MTGAGVRAVDDAVHRELLTGSPGDLPGPEHIGALVRRADPLLSAAEVAGAVARVRARMAGLGPLEPLLQDPDVTDILVNGYRRVFDASGLPPLG